MSLTLDEAARILGKSYRQVRYMIQNGEISATKSDGRWIIDDLPRSPGQTQAAQRKQARMVEVVEESLALPASGDRKRYSLRDLRAFQIGSDIYRESVQCFGKEHDACAALQQMLEHIARGCHRYRSEDKAIEYKIARDHASRAACAFALTVAVDGVSEAQALLDQVEQNLMAALAGLMRRMERPRKRTARTKPSDANEATPAKEAEA